MLETPKVGLHRGQGMKQSKVALCLSITAIALAGCSIKPVRINTGDGTEQYFLECGSDKSGCFSKANETCPKGYEVVEAKESTHFSANYWHAGSETDATLHIKCK